MMRVITRSIAALLGRWVPFLKRSDTTRLLSISGNLALFMGEGTVRIQSRGRGHGSKQGAPRSRCTCAICG
jgi:hypothetical protein